MVRNSSGGDQSDDVDPGEPIRELADIQEDPIPGFTNRLSRRIDLKVLGTQLIDLGRTGIGSSFRFYWSLLTALFSGRNDDGGKAH